MSNQGITEVWRFVKHPAVLRAFWNKRTMALPIILESHRTKPVEKGDAIGMRSDVLQCVRKGSAKVTERCPFANFVAR